jgi:hypothetical protein
VCCYSESSLSRAGNSGNEIRVMLVKVYGDNAMKENSSLQVGNVFLREEKVYLTKRDQDDQQQAELN